MRDDNTHNIDISTRGCPKNYPRGVFEWQRFDCLPLSVREIFFATCIPFHPSENIDKCVSFYGLTGTKNIIRDDIEKCEQESTKNIYGTDHPQANEVWGPLKPIRSPRRRRV